MDCQAPAADQYGSCQAPPAPAPIHGGLPFTGLDLGLMLAVGLALLIAGACFRLAGKGS